MSEEIISNSQLLQAVDDLVPELVTRKTELETGYAKLGNLLSQIQNSKAWTGPYSSFRNYLESVGAKFDLGCTQLYSYSSTVSALKEHVTEEQLNEMGIEKAKVLKWTMDQTGGVPPTREIIEAATNPDTSVADVRKLLFDQHNLKDDNKAEGMLWYDLGFYTTKEEAIDITLMLKNAQKIDPPIDGDIKDPKTRKKCILRVVADFNGTWSASVERGEA